MFSIKNKYFVIIENIKDIDLKNIKKNKKFSIIYRNNNKLDNILDLLRFRKTCKLKSIEFYIANDLSLAISLNSDGIYLSAYNRTFKAKSIKKTNFNIIGSAHNFKEISHKLAQGCKSILFSKLFIVDYDKSAPYLGIVKFNLLLKTFKNLVPLGGINSKTLNNLRNLNSEGIALMSEIKKKPTIIRRLF